MCDHLRWSRPAIFGKRPRRHGYSRDHRGDCAQVIIALVAEIYDYDGLVAKTWTR